MFLCLLIIYCTLVIGGSEFFYFEGREGMALGREVRGWGGGGNKRKENGKGKKKVVF